MKTSILFNTLVCAGVAFAASAYGADTLFDNLAGPNQGGASLYGYPGASMSFSTGSSSEQLTDVQLGMTDLSGGSGVVTVDLYSTSGTLDAGDPQPGALITTLGTIPNSDLSVDTVVTLSDEPILAPDTMYWIGLSGGGDSAAWIFTNASGDADEYNYHTPQSFSDADGDWMMEVQATPVQASAPDAWSTASLLGLSIGVLVVLRRKLAWIPAIQRA
jgi:hypothetical protein